MSALPEHVQKAIRERRGFDSGWLIGRYTPGGTFIVSSHPNTTDSGKPRDLIAVLPGDLGHGRVLSLYIGTNPEMVAEIERLVSVA